MLKKFLSIGVAICLGAITLIAPVQATDLTPHVYLSDYILAPDQDFIAYGDNLSPNTTYSIGLMAANEDLVNQWMNAFMNISGEFTTVTTDENGDFEVSLVFYKPLTDGFNDHYALISSYVYVDELGSTPEQVSDVIAKSHIVYPDPLSTGGTVTLPGLSGDTFPVGALDIHLSGFPSGIKNFEVHYVPAGAASDYESVLKYFNDVDLATFNTTLIFGEDQSGFDFNVGYTQTIPSNSGAAYMAVYLYGYSNVEDHSAAAIVLDAAGNVLTPSEIVVGNEIPSKVKPYSYVRGFFGSDDWNSIEVTKWEHCVSAGEYLMFLSPGLCEWEIKDSEGNVLETRSTIVSKTAQESKTAPLAHKSVLYKIGSFKLSKKENRKITSLEDSETWDQLMVLGYAWKEGKKAKMNQLSEKRTNNVVSRLETLGHGVYIHGGHGTEAPLYKKGKKQALNRRVEIIEIPAGIWVD